MDLLHILCALVMAGGAHTPVTLVAGEVTLSADADPAPGGYVVPEEGSITFTCNNSMMDGVFWRIDLQVPNGQIRSITSSGFDHFRQVSSRDKKESANPATITISNITSENNRTFVECYKDGSGMSNATIIVEGSPNCPTVNTTVTTSSLTVSIQNSQMTWLPEWYCVKAVSYNGSIAIMVYNSTLNGTAPFGVTSLQPDTVYNITVIPCNMAGCNESCVVHSVLTDSEGGIGVAVPTGSDVTPHTVSIQPLIFIGVAILVTMVLLIVVVVALASGGLLVRRKRGKWTVTKGTAEQTRTKPQSTQPEYAEMTMDHKATNYTEYGVVAHSNTSAKGHFVQGPSRQANTTCTTGPGNSQEYATVQDALHVTENVPQSHPSLTNTLSLPPSSPPAPPGSPAGVGISPDCVQDAGYASLPDSRNGSKRITKVRSIRQK